MRTMDHTTTVEKSRLNSYISPKARVIENGIDGKSVFAIEPIVRNELIAIWGGTILTSEELTDHDSSLQKYTLQIGENHFIVPDEISSVNDAEYFNHSCDPNCGIQGQIALVAMRDILPGEELSFDYAMSEGIDQNFLCRCGSENCRGTIKGTDHLLPELIKKYRGYFSTWIEKRHKTMDINSLMSFEKTGAWGLDTAVDLHDCDPEIIRSAESIRQFTIELCERIGVKRFGEPTIVNFGAEERVAGYSLVQLIETSLVSGHFANLTNHAYIDIFSCAYYDRDEVAAFAKEFFKAKEARYHTLLRF